MIRSAGGVDPAGSAAIRPRRREHTGANQGLNVSIARPMELPVHLMQKATAIHVRETNRKRCHNLPP